MNDKKDPSALTVLKELTLADLSQVTGGEELIWEESKSEGLGMRTADRSLTTGKLTTEQP